MKNDSFHILDEYRAYKRIQNALAPADYYPAFSEGLYWSGRS